MRSGYIGDVHLSTKPWPGKIVHPNPPARFDVGLHTFRRAMEFLYSGGATNAVQLGDMFDTTRIAWQYVKHVAEAVAKSSGLEVGVIAGNHDMSVSGNRDTGPCAFLPTADLMLLDIFCVDFVPGRDLEHLLVQIQDNISSIDVLACHIGVATDDTPDFMRASHDVIALTTLGELCSELAIRHVFAGNWHTPRTDTHLGVTVHQLGVLNPVGFGDGGFNRGRIALYDHTSGIVEYITVPGVRFVEINSPAEIACIPNDPGMEWLCLRIVVPLEDYSDADAQVRLLAALAPAWLLEKLISIDVRPRRAEVRDRAITAVSTTSESLGVDAAVHAYCAAHFQGDLANAVAATSLRYLRG